MSSFNPSETTGRSQADKDLCQEIRDNLLSCKKSDQHNRDAYTSNAKFLNLEQWDDLEAQKRRNKRLMLTTDMLNAPVDQVVNGVKQNKPGPSVSPEGNGADKLAADVFEGLLRRIDYDSSAWTAFTTAFECATGSNFGCWAVDIESKSLRSFERKIVTRMIPNPNETVFFDPTAIKKDRSDATWAAEVQTYSETLYKAEFGNGKAKSNIANKGPLKSILAFVDSFRDPSLTRWVTNDGIQVCKYWRVEIETDKLRRYSNGINYLDSEKDTIPARDAHGERVVEDKTRQPQTKYVRKIRWYITDGMDILKKGDWNGQYIPLFPVYGRERWVQGRRYISSMIQGAKNAQQAFNFAFTASCEVLASVPKSPWIGLLGQFKSKYNQWNTANTEIHAILEFDEVELKNNTTYTTAPQRIVQEPPIQAALAFCAMCVNAIQRATSVFDPSLGRQKADQSGKAINELQEQSSEGNFHWSDNLTTTLVHYYRALIDLCQNEYDAPQVIEILRADGTAESVWINKEFVSGKDAQGNDIKDHHHISHGDYGIAVDVGPSAKTMRQAAAMRVDNLVKVLPPELVAQAADLLIQLHDVGPLGDAIADRLVPAAYRDQNDPRQASQQLAQAMQHNQQLTQIVQKLQNAIQTKQPELELKKYVAELQALTQIRVAQEKNNNDEAERDAETLENLTNMAHEAASDSADRIHEMMLETGRQNHETNLAQMPPPVDPNAQQPSQGVQ